MKEYLLKPHKRILLLEKNGGEIFLLEGQNGLRGLSPLISDKYFVFIHFIYDQKCFLKTFYSQKDRVNNSDVFRFIQASDIHLSLGFRKTA
jgi:hypothetical protein